jgi:hypothetical protein
VTDLSSHLSVERIRLRAQGLDEGPARRLAGLVAENLAQDLRLPVGAPSLASLSVEVTSPPGATADETARRVAEAVRQLVVRAVGSANS